VSKGVASATRVLIDCRWLGASGVGRATEYLLRGLSELQPSGQWTLWGTSAVEPYLWPGARWVRSQFPPQALFGMREALDLPSHDVALYMHLSRPLVPGRSVTLIHDTIHLRYRSLARQMSQHLYNWGLARLATRVLTVSEYSRAAIERDIGIPAERIGVVRFPVDRELVARVLDIRARGERRDRALYVGQFARHKNLERLLNAFPRTQFARDGGELMLVGGSSEDAAHLRQMAPHGARVTIERKISQPALEELYATSRLLVLPSLEEGFGLPAWEALSVGLPVCVANAGALPETTQGHAHLFDPYSIDAIARAIDETAASEAQPLECKETMADYANAFIDALASV
jgi:glycosyltransferase involved in cell wall biosynthesis